jgi:multidrug resistance efflux pump
LDTHALTIKRDSLIARIDIAEIRQTDATALYFELEQTQRNLTRFTITAPIDGQVMWVASLRPGDALVYGQTVALLRR